jgi:alpha-L-arabinofuranosidase
VGTSYVFADSTSAPSAGDYLVLRKLIAGTAERDWFTERLNGGTVSTELSDLPPGTEGKQAIRLSAMNGGTAAITGPLDNHSQGPFIQLKGAFRLTFKGKGAGGGNTVNVFFRRGGSANSTFIDRALVLGPSWSAYTFDFVASENGTSTGPIDLQFAAATGSAVLLDDVSLVQTNSDPANTTVFRDPVVNALRSLRPGLIRYVFGQNGDSLDNQIAPPFARTLTGYNSKASANVTGLEYGLHEFLELCELVGAEPWYMFSVGYSTQEMTNLIEYLAGPPTSPYGAKRAARGRAAPWTNAFNRIHLEFGNEAWNDGDFAGGTISDPVAYGNRGSEIYGVARSSPYYEASKFDLVLGGQADVDWRNSAIHNASRNHDSFALGPYLAFQVNDYATIEQLFGPLFAEPEMDETTGTMGQTYRFLQSSSRPAPLSVYEVNTHSTEGSISQAALDSFSPSLGAGIAVAEHMLLMLRDLAIRDQMVCCLGGFDARRTDGKHVRLWGIVRDFGVTDRKRPLFLALKLANEALAGDLVRTTQSGDNPTWNQQASNGVTLSNAHFIQSFAFSNGDTRSVIVFNLSRTAPLDVNFTGANAPAGTVILKRLTGRAITDSNEDAENVMTTTQTLSNFNPAAAFSLPPYSMSFLQWHTTGTVRRRVVRIR